MIRERNHSEKHYDSKTSTRMRTKHLEQARQASEKIRRYTSNVQLDNSSKYMNYNVTNNREKKGLSMHNLQLAEAPYAAFWQRTTTENGPQLNYWNEIQ
jgi:hypothetical protein